MSNITNYYLSACHGSSVDPYEHYWVCTGCYAPCIVYKNDDGASYPQIRPKVKVIIKLTKSLQQQILERNGVSTNKRKG